MLRFRVLVGFLGLGLTVEVAARVRVAAFQG